MNFHVKQRDKALMDEGVLRAPGQNAALCTRCGCEPRIAGQRWGRACRVRYMRETYRPRQKQLRRAIADELGSVEAILRRMKIRQSRQQGG